MWVAGGGCEQLAQYRVHSGQAVVMCTSFLSRYPGFSETSGASEREAADENGRSSNAHPAQWPLLTCETLQPHRSHRTMAPILKTAWAQESRGGCVVRVPTAPPSQQATLQAARADVQICELLAWRGGKGPAGPFVV